MSTNCIRCVANERSGNDLLCDKCRAMTKSKKPYTVVVKHGATRPVCLKVGCQEFALAYDPGEGKDSQRAATWMARMLTAAMDRVYEAGRTAGKAGALKAAALTPDPAD